MNDRLQRARALAPLLGGLLSLGGCAGRLHQVPASEPHGVVELRFEQISRDFLYDNAVRIDDGEERTVKSGERVRLRPGTHQLELASIAHSYGLGTVQVTRPGPCIDPRCTRYIPVTEPQAALVETGQERCTARLDIAVEPNSQTVVQLQVAADQSCTIRVAPGAQP